MALRACIAGRASSWLVGSLAHPRQRPERHALLAENRGCRRRAVARDRGSPDVHGVGADAAVPALAFLRLSFPGSHSVWLGVGALQEYRLTTG